MMQLDEMARQASTDVKLAVMDLEAPPIGAVKGKGSIGWAKPLFAMAALFLIAGTSWVLLGGNQGVEDTLIADADTDSVDADAATDAVDADTDAVANVDLGDAEVRPLTHPEADMESVTPFRTVAEGVAAGLDNTEPMMVFQDSEADKGFVLLVTGEQPNMFEAEEVEFGDEVRGLPTLLSGEDPGLVRIVWYENETTLAIAASSQMTQSELLTELQHPEIILGDHPNTEFSLVGTTRFFADSPLESVGLTGFNNSFDVAGSSFVTSTFLGSIDGELAVNSVIDAGEAVATAIRNGKPAYIGSSEGFDQFRWILWEESPGVVAYLISDEASISDDELLEIVEQLEAGPVPADDSTESSPVEAPNEQGDDRQAGVSPLVPADGEDAIVQELPNPSGNKRVIATWIYYQDNGDGASEDDTPELAVTRVADASAEDLAGEDFSDTILLFDGSVNAYRDGARAVWKDGPDFVIVVGASSTPDELLATIDATPGIGSGEVPDGLERRGGGAKRNPASGSYSFSLDVTGFDAYVGLGVDAFYAVTTYDTDAAEELAAHQYLVPEAVSRNIRNGKRSLHSVDEAGDRQQLIWAESEFVIAILETTPDVSVEQMYTWAENLVPLGTNGEDIELTAAEAASPAGQRIEALRQSPSTKVLLFRLYDEGRAADIFYEVDSGREVCVETVGLDTPVQCFTAEASPPAAYFIRTNADDFDAGERSVLVVMYASDSGSTFQSSDALERSNLTSGMELIVGALYADDPVLEILDDNGVLLENLTLR